jgi:CheY-like chemotaxis protein
MEEAMTDSDSIYAIRGLINDLARSLTSSLIHLDNLMIDVDENNVISDELCLANDQLEQSLHYFLELRSLYLLKEFNKIAIGNNNNNKLRSLTHNINNLLTIIIGCCDTLNNSIEVNRIRKFIEKIYDNICESKLVNTEGLRCLNALDVSKGTLASHDTIHKIIMLLVEDDNNLREFMFNALPVQKYDVIQCDNGSNAIVAFANNKNNIDICLIDYELPDMNGCKLAERILTIKNNTNILFMSGYNELIITVKNSNKELQLIHKPFNISYIMKTIDNLLNQNNINS